MLYNRTNNILEIFLKNKANLHNIEDYLREKLFYKNEYLCHLETIFLARILYGRIINSNEINQKLDARHSKAQIITVTCLAFYLYKNKDILSKNIKIELYNLLQYHIILIEQHLNTYSVNVSFKNDDNYYNYCKDLNFICKIISLHKSFNNPIITLKTNGYNDDFTFEFCYNHLIVKRKDCPYGWGHPHKIHITESK